MLRMSTLALMCAAAVSGCNKTYSYAPFGAPCAGKLPDGETGFMPQGSAAKEASRFPYYRCMARRDDMEGQYRLGVAYEDGLGTAIDLKKARWWYEQAAEPRSGVALKRSWLSGTTYGQLLPYTSRKAKPGHPAAQARLNKIKHFVGD